MLNAAAVIPQEVLAAYVRRHNAALITPGMDTAQIWSVFLHSVGGKGSSRKSGSENAWLDSLGAQGGNLTDKWQQYLTSQGYTGTLHNMMREFFKNS